MGWIDGQKRSYDAEWFLQRFTPRTRRSPWSQRNREHVARLTAAGLMLPAGLAAVEAAKADGRWDAAYAGSARSRCHRTWLRRWTLSPRLPRSSKP